MPARVSCPKSPPKTHRNGIQIRADFPLTSKTSRLGCHVDKPSPPIQQGGEPSIRHRVTIRDLRTETDFGTIRLGRPRSSFELTDPPENAEKALTDRRQ